MSAIIVPLKKDKIEGWKAWIDECLGPRREEFDEFHERMGITGRRMWLAQGPQGPMVVVVLDGPGADDYFQNLANSKEPFDKWFRERVSEFTGTDVSRLAELKPSEMVMDWKAPSYVDVTE